MIHPTSMNFIAKAVAAIFILLLWMPINAKDYSVAGFITDEEGKPLPGALFTIIGNENNPDDMRQAVAEEDGSFLLEAIPEGEYGMKVSCNGYINIEGRLIASRDYKDVVFNLTPDPEAKATQLDEVEVMAKALQSYADRDEMYLSSYNRKYGVNALDAVSSLPRFLPTINGSALLNNQGQDVNILIDGRKADVSQLRNLNGNDIAKVVYYQDAPAKYRGLYGGAVVNVILRKPKQIRINGKIDAQAAVTAAQTADGIGFTVFSPHGLLDAGYSFNYRNMGDVMSRERYDYGDLVNSLDMTSARYENKKHRASVSYQFERKSNLFYANFLFNTSDAHNRQSFDLTEKTAVSDIAGYREDIIHPGSDSFSLDLYYSHDFGSGRELMVDVVGTINKTRRSLSQTQVTGAGSAYDDFLNISNTDALVRSVIANASYTSPLWGGTASVSLMNHYRHVRQNYTSSMFPDLPSLNVSSTDFLMAALGYTRQFGRLGMDLNLAFNDYITMGSDGKKHNDFYVSPRLSLNYGVSNIINLRMMGWMESTLRGSASQNINRYVIDTRYFRENIPYMTPSYRYKIYFTPEFNIGSADLILSPSLLYTYERNGYMNYIYREGDLFIQRPVLLPHSNNLSYDLTLIWMPTPGLQIRPMLSGNHKAFRTPEGPERFNSFQCRLLASYAVKSFQFQAYLTTPERNLDGITHKRKGWTFYLNAYWTTPTFYAGVDFSYQGDTSSTVMEVPGFSSVDETRYGEMRNFVTISLGYNFSIGKYKGSAKHRKKLNNAETETGL